MIILTTLANETTFKLGEDVGNLEKKN